MLGVSRVCVDTTFLETHRRTTWLKVDSHKNRHSFDASRLLFSVALCCGSLRNLFRGRKYDQYIAASLRPGNSFCSGFERRRSWKVGADTTHCAPTVHYNTPDAPDADNRLDGCRLLHFFRYQSLCRDPSMEVIYFVQCRYRRSASGLLVQYCSRVKVLEFQSHVGQTFECICNKPKLKSTAESPLL